jgi:predicted short-subunit dehydrogenase-like oxidoreductase (DUF2520 family)
MTATTIGLVGAGAAGASLLLALHRQGFVIGGVASRRLDSAKRCAARVACQHASDDPAAVAKATDLLFIATPDGVISEVCEQIARQGGFRPGQSVAHLSGALSSDALQAARAAGASVMALHPVQTLVEPEQGADNLLGAYFGLEGDPSALTLGRRLVAALHGHAVEIGKEDKPLYHAALCVASNYLVGLADVAARMLAGAGVDKDIALPLMLPLMRGALDNLGQTGLPSALTGPISRGDAETVQGHLQALRKEAPQLVNFYRELGRQAQQLAEQKGQQDRAGQIRLQALLNESDTE